MSEENNGYTVEQAYEDLMSGLEYGINELTTKLNSDLNSLTKSELRRALQAVINYPDGIKVFHSREEQFIKNLVALHGLHLRTEMQVIADLQKQYEEGEQNVEKTKDNSVG